MAKYTVQVLGGYQPLFKGNDRAQAEAMRIRWAMQMRHLQVDIILVDNETGEVLAGV